MTANKSSGVSFWPWVQIALSDHRWLLLYQYNLLKSRQYSQYFLLFSPTEMSSLPSLPHYLSEIHAALGLNQKWSEGTNFHCQIQKMKQELFNCRNGYFGDVARNVLLAKIKIDEALNRAQSTAVDGYASCEQSQNLTSGECFILNAIKHSLAELSSDIDHLLREGILTLYMELCDIREKSGKKKVRKLIEGLLRSVIEIVAGLLKPFFIYQEYTRCREAPSGGRRKKNILSLRNLNNTPGNANNKLSDDFDEKLMREVEEALSQKPVAELLQSFTRYCDVLCREQTREMNETLQVCRICSYQIKLQSMERHVKMCQKKCQLKLQIEERSAAVAALLQQLKAELQLISDKSERSEEEESLRRVAKLLLCSQKKKKERNNIRRSSLAGGKSEKSFRDKIQELIEEYEYDHGHHFILHRILQASRQKGYLQKKINALQVSNLNSDHNDSDSPQLKSEHKIEEKMQGEDRVLEFVSTRKFQLAKSVEYGQRESSINSSQQNLPIASKSSDFSSHFLRDIPTRRSLKRRSTGLDLQEVYRHYVSLQDITFEQEQALSVSLQNFQLLQFLGQGAFGRVYLVRRAETGDLYALKVVRLEGYDGQQLEAVKNEHQIFKKIAGDHLVRAPFAFSERQAHMFVLEYLPGGDLRRMLNDEVYFQQDTARFYLAEIVLAIEHLHKFDIIHRDLKPENLVVDRDGHLKLTDFGLSELQIKAKMEHARRLSQQEAKDIRRRRLRRSGGFWGNASKVKLIGTPDYIAPEIITQVSVKNFTIDWWSLGVIAYELLIGTRPFCGETIEQVVDNITNHRLQWPEVGYEEGMISPQAQDLIAQLLKVDFGNRLGANGAEQIKSHPFFRGIDWSNLKKSRPPSIPQGIGNYDQLRQQKQLREQVYRLVGSSSKLNKRLHLQRFVRFDLLGDATIETVQKVYEQKNSRINKLKTIRRLELQLSDSGASKGSDQ